MAIEDDQAALVSAFVAGDVDGAPAPIERLDTHLSHVFLTGAHAFKLKRAVALPFVDFRTLEQRRAACEAELAVNQRMAPTLYEAVRPVTIDNSGRYHIGGDGVVVEWVVAMRRFSDAFQFDRLARSGSLSVILATEVAEAVARMHIAAPQNALAGHTADYRAIIEELGRTEAHGAAALNLSASSAPLLVDLNHEASRVSPLIERRRRAGKVRRGHGDLHLSNICVFEGKPVPFDALEFDERMATSDVIHDLAFLLMDLRRFGLDTQANTALNAYWDAAAEDEEGLALLPLFVSLRAAVMTAISVEQGRVAEADRYRRLGLECLRRTEPTFIAIGGLSGSGKSAVAKALAPRLSGPAGARLLRTDVLRKQLAGASPGGRLRAEAYTPAERDRVYQELSARAASATLARASVITDATFQDTKSRASIEAAGDVEWRGYWLDAPVDIRVARIARRRNDPSDADEAVAAAQRMGGGLSPLWRRLDASRPVEYLVAEIEADLPRA